MCLRGDWQAMLKALKILHCQDSRTRCRLGLSYFAEREELLPYHGGLRAAGETPFPAMREQLAQHRRRWLESERENLLSGPLGTVLPSNYKVVTHVYISRMGEFWSPRVKGKEKASRGRKQGL